MKSKIKIAAIAIMGMSFGVSSQDNKIDSTGDVGIGTINPKSKLDIFSTNPNDHWLTRLNTNQSNWSGFWETSDNIRLLLRDTNGNIDVDFRPNGNSYIKGGNVGIGTSNPIRSLHVTSNLWDNSSGSGVIFENRNPVGSGITLKPTASQVLNGNLGWAIYAGGPSSVVKDGNLGFWAHGTNKVVMSVNRSGKVGVGTNTPSEKLDVNGNLKISGDLKMSGSDSYIWTNGTGTGYTGIWDQKNSRVLFYTSEVDGNVGIGTRNTKGFKLGVNGKVAATEVKIATYSNWADFVFEKDYKLSTLIEVENHIITNGHLKGIPSAKEVAKNGFFLGEMNSKLLQKIEELTLYTIEQEKKLNNQKEKFEKQQEEIEELKKQNSKIDKQQKQIERLENLVNKFLKDKI